MVARQSGKFESTCSESMLPSQSRNYDTTPFASLEEQWRSDRVFNDSSHLIYEGYTVTRSRFPHVVRRVDFSAANDPYVNY
jgi:hypothetical protein